MRDRILFVDRPSSGPCPVVQIAASHSHMTDTSEIKDIRKLAAAPRAVNANWEGTEVRRPADAVATACALWGVKAASQLLKDVGDGR